jgi:hypothetical protein
MSLADSRKRASLTVEDQRIAEHLRVWKLSTGERVLLDLLGRHPFTHSQVLAAVLGVSALWVRRYTTSLVRRGLAQPVLQPAMTPGHEIGVELSVAGLRRLCAYLGVPLGTAVRFHGLAGGGHWSPVGARRALLRNMEHTMGADVVFAQIAQAARQLGGELSEWRNAGGCAQGRMRPDGYGVVRLRRRDYGFFLEYDRGTVRGRALRAKFSAYARVFTSARAAGEYDGIPAVLVVTTGPGAEARILSSIECASIGYVGMVPIFVTTVGWIANEPLGPLGPVWRRPAGRSRQSWWL